MAKGEKVEGKRGKGEREERLGRSEEIYTIIVNANHSDFI